MLFTSLLAFLGGSTFRMLWGEVSGWLNRQQDHRHQLELLELQERVSAAQHERNLAAQRLQAELGIQVIEVQSQAHVAGIEAQAWLEAVKATGQRSGYWIADAWNAVIRPSLATWSIVMITGDTVGWWRLSENGWMLASAALGIYVADRTLFKKGR